MLRESGHQQILLQTLQECFLWRCGPGRTKRWVTLEMILYLRKGQYQYQQCQWGHFTSVWVAPDHNALFALQASGPTPKNKKPPSKPVASSGGGGKKGGEAKKNGKPPGNGEVSEEDPASASSTPKKAAAKDTNRKRKPEEQETPVCVKRAKTARDNNRDLGLCRYVPPTCSDLCLCWILHLFITFF